MSVILIVEDEMIVRLVAEMTIRGQGYETISAGDVDKLNAEIGRAREEFVREGRNQQNLALLSKLAEAPEPARKELAYTVLLHVNSVKNLKKENKKATKAKQEFNALESRARIAEDSVAFWQAQARAQNAPAPQPEETDDALLERLSANPTRVLPEQISKYVEPLQQQIYEQNVRLLRMAGKAACEPHQVGRGALAG